MPETRMAVAEAIREAGEGCLSGAVYVDPYRAADAVLCALSALRDAGTGRDSGEAEDDRFSRELQAAYDRNDADGYARILSGRLRQMDKRARAANVRADQLEAKLRLMRVRAEGAQRTGRERAADLCDARAEYFEGAPGHREWTDAARSYRATAKEIRALQTESEGHE